MKLFTIILALALLTAGASNSTTINIPADQPTIQAGIDAAVDGDTVLVAPDDYVENIDFSGKSIVVQSMTGPSTTRLLPMTLTQPVIQFTSSETRNARFSGFTVDGASVTIGIMCKASSPSIEFSIVTNCATSGAIVCDSGSNALLETVTVANNLTNGVFLKPNAVQSSKVSMKNCTIRENMGDGLWAFTEDSVIVLNSTFDSNGSHGLFLSNGSFAAPGYLRIDSSLFESNQIGCLIDGGVSGTITNSTFHLNIGGSGYGVMIEFGNNRSSLLFENCDFTGNLTGAYLQSSDTITFRNCLVQDNLTGIFSDFTSLSIEGGTIKHNANFGISTMSANRPIRIENTLIHNNGVGIDACCGDSIVVLGCTIANNSAELGSAINSQFQVSVRIRNSILAFNNGDDWVYYSSGGLPADSTITISCSDIFANGSGGIPDIIVGQLFSNNNFLADPQFCDTTFGDFRILSTSPSLPTGNSCNQLAGALGVGCAPTCCTVPGDFTGDSAFNITDVTFGIARIFSGGPPPPCQDEGDSNGDNTFNIADVTYGIARIFSGGPAPICGTTGT